MRLAVEPKLYLIAVAESLDDGCAHSKLYLTGKSTFEPPYSARHSLVVMPASLLRSKPRNPVYQH